MQGAITDGLYPKNVGDYMDVVGRATQDAKAENIFRVLITWPCFA